MVMDGSSLFFVFCFDDAKFDDDGVPSSWLLGTYLSDEAGGNGERPIGDRHRKRRQTALRRTKHDLRALAGIIFGIVAHALKKSLSLTSDFTQTYIRSNERRDSVKTMAIDDSRDSNSTARTRVAASAGQFLDGLLGNEPRKTGWMRAEAVGDPGPWRQQAILGRGRWDAGSPIHKTIPVTSDLDSHHSALARAAR
jgi:hypothetical protein